jgi:hypothetical protein
MGARWTIPADPDRLERAAQDHEIVANEYEGRADWFRARPPTSVPRRASCATPSPPSSGTPGEVASADDGVSAARGDGMSGGRRPMTSTWPRRLAGPDRRPHRGAGPVTYATPPRPTRWPSSPKPSCAAHPPTTARDAWSDLAADPPRGRHQPGDRHDHHRAPVPLQPHSRRGPLLVPRLRLHRPCDPPRRGRREPHRTVRPAPRLGRLARAAARHRHRVRRRQAPHHDGPGRRQRLQPRPHHAPGRRADHRLDRSRLRVGRMLRGRKTNREPSRSTASTTRRSPRRGSWCATRTLGSSATPRTGLVGDDGLIEVKSRRPRSSSDHPRRRGAGREHGPAVRRAARLRPRVARLRQLLRRDALYVKRVYPDQRWFDAIVAAVEQFEEDRRRDDRQPTRPPPIGMPMTERVIEMEMTL